MLARKGRKLPEEEYEKMIKEYTQTEQISFKQFMKLMDVELELCYHDSGSFGKSYNDLIKQLSLSTSGTGSLGRGSLKSLSPCIKKSLS